MPNESEIRILFVDDEPHVTQALRRALRNEEFVVLTATSGSRALELLEQNDIAVVVSDERMPEQSGSELMGVPVTVTGVDIKLRSGRGRITGLEVANPSGYSSENAFRMNLITPH